MDNLNPVQNLRPFTKFCMSIGAIPTSYLISMTYEEQLLWLCDYIQNTVIPTVNNNAGCITELQNLYIELKNYCDNYFTNLDVQEEINNKLDNLVTDGTLTNLIANYVNPYISEQNSKIITIENKVNSVASGSPAGVYDTLSALQSANPDHSKTYVVTEDGKWYYYNTTTSNWSAGGVYQATQISNNSISEKMLNNFLINKTNNLYNKLNLPKLLELNYTNGYINDTGNISANYNYCYSDIFNMSNEYLSIVIDNPNNYSFSYYILKYDNNTFVSRSINYTNTQQVLKLDKNYSYRILATLNLNVIENPEYIQYFNQIFKIYDGSIYNNDIELLKNTLNAKNYDFKYDLKSYYKSGQCDSQGNLITSTNNIVNELFFNPDEPIVIILDDNINFYISIFEYNLNGDFIKYSSNNAIVNILSDKNKNYRIAIITNNTSENNIYDCFRIYKGTFNNYYFKKGMVFGDSITNGDGERLWNRYFKYLTFPLNYDIIAVSGATWCNLPDTVMDGNPWIDTDGTTHNDTIPNQVQKIINNSENYQIPDYIVISAGTNDNIQQPISDEDIEAQFWDNLGNKINLSNVDLTTLAGAMRWCVEKLRELFPNVEIFICTPIQRLRSTTNNSNYTNLINIKRDAIMRIARRLGCKIWDSNECGVYDMTGTDGTAQGDFNDGLHLSVQGAKKLGNYNAVQFINWYNHPQVIN